MYVTLPTAAVQGLIPTTVLAEDKDIVELGIHPGDELKALGFPLGLASNDIGFPILRSGQIASYPLLPTKETLTFLFDFRIFDGNSGGPVYLVDSNKTYGGGTHLGATNFLIMGLVTSEVRITQQAF